MGFWIPAAWLLLQPSLLTPWACGETHSVTRAHNVASHTGHGAWAWDFDLGVGTPVHAAAPGRVVRVRQDSTQGGCDRDRYAHAANYVVVDHGDGTHALYLHLQAYSVPLEVGDHIDAGDRIGTVGLTGYVCGAHLHFQLQAPCDGWWCPSMPATFTDYGDPGLYEVLESNNCAPPPPVCAPQLVGQDRLVDELDPCFVPADGPWQSHDDGFGGHHFAVSPPDASRAHWSLPVTVAGYYELDAYVPADGADAVARFGITHADGIDHRVVDQSADKGWQSLGIYRFATGADGQVDLWAEGSARAGAALAFDTLSLRYRGRYPPTETSEAPPPSVPPPSSGPPPAPAPEPPPPPETGVAPEPVAPSAPSPSTTAETAPSGRPPLEGALHGGCRAHHPAPSGTPVGALIGLLLGGLAWSRRRQARRGPRH